MLSIPLLRQSLSGTMAYSEKGWTSFGVTFNYRGAMTAAYAGRACYCHKLPRTASAIFVAILSIIVLNPIIFGMAFLLACTDALFVAFSLSIPPEIIREIARTEPV